MTGLVNKIQNKVRYRSQEGSHLCGYHNAEDQSLVSSTLLDAVTSRLGLTSTRQSSFKGSGVIGCEIPNNGAGEQTQSSTRAVYTVHCWATSLAPLSIQTFLHLFLCGRVFAWMHGCTLHTCNSHRGQKVSDSLRLEFARMVVSHHISAGNLAQVLWKRSQCS